MTYKELLEMAKRAVSISPDAPVDNLLDVIQILNNHGAMTRTIATDRLAFLMAEFIEEPIQQASRSTKH